MQTNAALIPAQEVLFRSVSETIFWYTPLRSPHFLLWKACLIVGYDRKGDIDLHVLGYIITVTVQLLNPKCTSTSLFMAKLSPLRTATIQKCFYTICEKTHDKHKQSTLN